MHRILVHQIMKTPVITIRPEALVADAAQLMEEFDIRRLPVVDEDECVVGIATDTDVLEAETADSVLMNSYEPGVKTEWLTVADIMTRDVITIGPEATVGELAATLMEHKIGGVPVVETDARYPKRKHLVGIVTEVDIFAMIAGAWRSDKQQQPAES
jgi:acetoin utilization protein AcuB